VIPQHPRGRESCCVVCHSGKGAQFSVCLSSHTF
jgi:hypothetical protein